MIVKVRVDFMIRYLYKQGRQQRHQVIIVQMRQCLTVCNNV